MDILKEIKEKDKELDVLYALVGLQTQNIKELNEKIAHLEKLLMHKAHLIEKKD